MTLSDRYHICEVVLKECQRLKLGQQAVRDGISYYRSLEPHAEKMFGYMKETMPAEYREVVKQYLTRKTKEYLEGGRK